MHNWLVSFLGVLALASAGAGGSACAQADDFAFDVDLELVLAVDVSRSMDIEEQHVQRDGYVAAFRHPDVIDAIRTGPLGKIAVTYLEWAGAGHRTVVVPWTVIADTDDAEAFADRLTVAPVSRISGTSISSALYFAASLFGEVHTGYRQTIDVSGDGPNNAGRPVEPSRDEIVARGVTINGLPIMLREVNTFSAYGVPNLDVYYEDCVIGGPGSFVIPVRDIDDFASAIRQKLILEIAGREPEFMYAAEVEEAPRVDCLVGEKSRRAWYYNRR